MKAEFKRTKRAELSQGEAFLQYPTLVEKLASQYKVPENKVRAIVGGLVKLSAEGLKAGKIVRIAGLGSLHVRVPKADDAAGLGASLSTVPKKRVVLAASKKFKAAVDLDL